MLRGQNELFRPMRELNYSSDIGFCYGIAEMAMQAILAKELDRFDYRLALINSLQENQAPNYLANITRQRIAIIQQVKQQLSQHVLTNDERQAISHMPEVVRKITQLQQIVRDLVQQGQLPITLQEAEFERRREIVLRNVYLQYFIDQALETLPRQQQVSAEIPAFFEGMLLYQNIKKHRALLKKGQKIPHQNFSGISPLVLSTKLEEQGGVCRLEKLSGIYTMDELTQYFEGLRQTIKQTSPPLNDPIVFVLISSQHAITIAYNPTRDDWMAVDANQLPTQCIENTNDLAHWIMEALLCNNIVAFSTEIYVNQSNKHRYSRVITAWKNHRDWESMHNVCLKSQWTDANQASWLHVAAISEQTEIVNQLIAHQANLNSPLLNNHATPLQIAVTVQSTPITETLLTHGANPNVTTKEQYSSLMQAANYGNNELLTLLLAYYANQNHSDNYGQTALHHAALYGHDKIITSLIAANANPNVFTKEGYTPLHVAAHGNQLACANALLQGNADPNLSKGSEGITPLHVAIINGNIDMVKALLSKGANPFLSFKSDIAKLRTLALDKLTQFAIENWLRRKIPDASLCYTLTAKELAEMLGNQLIVDCVKTYERTLNNPYTFFNFQTSTPSYSPYTYDSVYCSQPR